MSDATMNESTGRALRPEKIATVGEIAAKLRSSDAVFVTEYRGMNVRQLADMRSVLHEHQGEHKIYKNTLTRLAVREAGIEGLEDLLSGPTALTFVRGDIAASAKALRDVARTNPRLVLRGGVLGESVVSAADITALADLPTRDELLAQVAGALQAPMVKTAGLLQALPRNLAYGLSARIEQLEEQDAA